MTLVLAAPALDPGSQRIEMTLPEGLTVAEIVATALPGATAADRAQARVMLVSPRGASVIRPGLWSRVRPRPGVRVVIRVIPGDDALRSILSIVVAVAAVSLGQTWAAALFPAATKTGLAIASSAIGLGVNLIGMLLINALIPPPKPEDERRSYSLTGWRNRLDPDGAVPVVLGQIRYAPPFGAMTWTEIVGDEQFLRALFLFGEGRVGLTDLRIGDTPLGEYDEVETEIREGLAGDAPCSLYPRQIVEEQVGAELTRPLPRDDAGEVIDGPAEETPVVRTTGADAAEASVILAWPAGLVKFSDSGRKKAHAVQIRIEQRPVTTDDWTLVTTLTVTAKKVEAFYRQHSWAFPSRGRWQVRMTMLTDETERSQVQQRTTWAGLQTIRPEYPLAYHRPLALVALRVRATHQLSGQLDNLSAMARRVCPDWDHVTATWITRATSNPASLFRFILQCPANPKIAGDAEIDLVLLADWHDFCRLKGLHYNRVQDRPGTTLREVLTEVAAAGRATPRHDGLKWGVVIDRPGSLIVDHVNPRNSWAFSVRRAYVEKPHAFITKFQDQDNDFKEAQRVIRRPGFAGDITLTETLDQPGLTDAAIVWREGYRRFLEAEYRPDVFEATQEGAVRVATRGDRLALSHDVLSRTQWAGRVRRVTGTLVEIDEAVTMVAGETYGLRFRTGLTDLDPIGTSAVRTVDTIPGETTALTLAGSGAMPAPGDIVHFGPMASESFTVVVTGVETTEDQCSILRAVAAAPEIDSLTDAAVIPPWSSRVGAELDPSALAPGQPRFTAVTTALGQGADPDTVDWLVAPGPGQIAPASYELNHREGTSGGWTAATVPAANGGGQLTVYEEGDTVQLRVRGISAAAVAGAWSATVTVVVGAEDLAVPGALDADLIAVATRLGGASVTVVTPADPAIARLQIFRSATTTLDREADAYGQPVAAEGARSYVLPVGDQTRVSLIQNGDFGSATGWFVPADVTIAGGVAVKAAGADIRFLRQSPAMTAGETLRVGYRITASVAGPVRIRCIGTTNADGPVGTATGSYRGTLTVPASPADIGAYFTAAADLTIDDVVVYRPTPACLPQGTQYLWLEAQNADGVPGPVAGPFAITID
jgi:hypothetical protein